VPANSLIVMQVHYHPTGGDPETDSDTKWVARWMDTPPTYSSRFELIGNYKNAVADGKGLLPGPNDTNGVEFLIPAGVADHSEVMVYTIPQNYPDLLLWGVANHMHMVGVDMKLEIERANPLAGEPATECLLQTPKWDFGWQRLYEYDTTVEEAVTARAGDTLRVTCRYNNTLENFQLLEALEEQGLTEPVDVGMGSDSLDEMCLGAFSMAYQL
jgi:hypothetical protein